MAGLKVMITGATGMVGEGVLLECLQNPKVETVLSISRRHYEISHPKWQELIVPDFFHLEQFAAQIAGYDACFFCAGVSSVGMKEDKYRYLTYDLTMAFAEAVLAHNPGMRFCYVSGSHTDSSEQGRMMWARVKGKTGNDLGKLPFGGEYNFRPGAMLPFDGQRNWKKGYKTVGKILKMLMPKQVLTLEEVGKAMINVVTVGYPKSILEIADIRAAAKM